MSCNCINEIEGKAKEHLKDKYAKPVEDVRMKEIAFPITENSIGMVTFNYLEVELIGQKKREQVQMNHNYCPFCGKPYNQSEEEAACAKT